MFEALILSSDMFLFLFYWKITSLGLQRSDIVTGKVFSSPRESRRRAEVFLVDGIQLKEHKEYKAKVSQSMHLMDSRI